MIFPRRGNVSTFSKRRFAAKMIAMVDDLEAIAGDDRAKVAALTGWRRELFGAKAFELKHGRLALTVEEGKVAPLEWQDGAPEKLGAVMRAFQRTRNLRAPINWRRT
jgi:hypothetical protein